MSTIHLQPRALMVMANFTHVIGLFGFTGVYLYVVLFCEGILFYRFPWNVVIPVGLLFWWFQFISEVLVFTKLKMLADEDGITAGGKRYLWRDAVSALGATRHSGWGSPIVRVRFKNSDVLDVPMGMTGSAELWKLIQKQVPAATVVERIGEKSTSCLPVSGQNPEYNPASHPPTADLSDRKCPICGQRLRRVQVETMLGNSQYSEWCRNGFCSYPCYEKHQARVGLIERQEPTTGSLRKQEEERSQ
jgi:hypothetical protein